MTDFTTEAVDTIEKVVGAVRERTVVPADRATRWVVYGFLASFCVLFASVLLVFGAFRAADVADGGGEELGDIRHGPAHAGIGSVGGDLG